MFILTVIGRTNGQAMESFRQVYAISHVGKQWTEKLSKLEDRKPLKTSLFLSWFHNPSGPKLPRFSSYEITPRHTALGKTSLDG